MFCHDEKLELILTRRYRTCTIMVINRENNIGENIIFMRGRGVEGKNEYCWLNNHAGALHLYARHIVVERLI